MRFDLDVKKTSALNPIWSMGGNTCHAALWLRDDLKRHLKRARAHLGFRYIRAHGILNDDMGVVSADGKTFNFAKPIAAIEGLLDLGLKPFVELSSMPGALASGQNKLTHYGFRSDPPKDWKRWRELIFAFGEALVERFGEAEVASWRFEVWNEPDIGFWQGGLEGYLKLYDLAASALKEVSAKIRVGGPATARTRWMAEFCDHVSKPSPDDKRKGVRCDFISTHAYPSDIEFVDTDYCDVKLQSANIMRELFGKAREIVDAKLGKGFPIIAGEWNSSAGPYAANHDDANNGAFIAKTMVELSDVCDGSLYWDISDIYEEGGFHYLPFHGGYGIITVNGVAKSSYHAFRLLNAHCGARVEASPDSASERCGCLASLCDKTLRVLLWNYTDASAAPAKESVSLAGLPKALSVAFERVEAGHGSPYETWLEMGSPDFVDRQLLDALEKAAEPVKGVWRSMPKSVELAPGSLLQLTFQLA